MVVLKYQLLRTLFFGRRPYNRAAILARDEAKKKGKRGRGDFGNSQITRNKWDLVFDAPNEMSEMFPVQFPCRERPKTTIDVQLLVPQ